MANRAGADHHPHQDRPAGLMLWHVVVEAWDEEAGNGDYYETLVLAHTERSARSLATREVKRLGTTGAHSVEATLLDVRDTGTVFITQRCVNMHPLFRRVPPASLRTAI